MIEDYFEDHGIPVQTSFIRGGLSIYTINRKTPIARFVQWGNRGTFHLICVDGDMDIRKDKSGAYKFSWDGNDECYPSSGFGEFSCDSGTLTGRIYIHDGDDSSFVAKKISENGPSFS